MGERRYLVEGRIIPERVDISVPQMQVVMTGQPPIECRVEIIKSRIFIHLDTSGDINIPDLRNALFTLIGDVVNMAGFMFVLGISYEIDSITSIDEHWTQVFGTEGHAFHDVSEFGQRLTFRQSPYGATEMQLSLFGIPAVSRANFELRNSIRYPDYTALHCRLAIEAIRNHFDADDERRGWQVLRDTLNVNRDTIELFKDAATLQRHGQTVPQTWEQRRQAMQIAWEICHRFFVWLVLDPQMPLTEPDFPKF